MSTREERLEAILERIAEAGSIEVGRLSRELGVSAVTARRDLDALAERRLLQRTRGGARAIPVNYNLSLRHRETETAEAKRAVARRAVEMIPAGGTIGLSGGTTTSLVADMLATREELLADLTVVTNAVDIAHELAVHRDVKVVMCGGVLNQSSFELVGSFVEPVLKALRLDVAFIGAQAFSARDGAMTPDEQEAHVNAVMAERAHTAALVADSSKYGERAFAAIGHADVFDVLITDEHLDDDAREAMTAAGYEVLRAAQETR